MLSIVEVDTRKHPFHRLRVPVDASRHSYRRVGGSVDARGHCYRRARGPVDSSILAKVSSLRPLDTIGGKISTVNWPSGSTSERTHFVDLEYQLTLVGTVSVDS